MRFRTIITTTLLALAITPAFASGGVIVRQSGSQIVFRRGTDDAYGNPLATGTTTLKLYELEDDGTLKSYDWSSNTFKTTALTTETASMSAQLGNNGATTTGIWTYALSTLTGFTKGKVYVALTNNASASPPYDRTEWVYGGADGDLPSAMGSDNKILLSSSDTTAGNVSTLLNGLILATGSIIDGSSTTTVLDTSLPTGGADIFTGDTIVITSGTYKGKSTHILSYNTANGQVTIPAALPGVLANGTTFELCSFSKTLTNMLAALGSDYKPLLSSSDTQSGTEAAASILVTPSQKIATNGSNQVVASSVVANVTVGGYASGQSPASSVLDTAASGHVISGSIGAAIGGALQTSAYTTPPTVPQIAAAILANPSNLLVTDSSGSPVLSTAVMQALRDTYYAKLIDGTIDAQGYMVLELASLIGKETNTWSSSNHANTGVRFRQDGVTSAYTNVTQYGTTQTALPATGVTSTVNTPLH